MTPINISDVYKGDILTYIPKDTPTAPSAGTKCKIHMIDKGKGRLWIKIRGSIKMISPSEVWKCSRH